MDNKAVGKFICKLRKDKGLTQTNLAEMLNISNRTVSKWENGDGSPDISILPELAAVLDVTVDELLKGEKNQKEVADIKVTEIANKDNLDNLFKISFVVSLFFVIFGAILGGVTELYSIYAFNILFYNHWEIIFVAAAFLAIITGGLVFSVGVTRLGVAYTKEEILKTAGKKTWLLALISSSIPILFLIRVIDCSRYRYYTDVFGAVLVAAALAVFYVLYKKLK